MDEEPIRMTREEYEKRRTKVLELRKQVLNMVENLIEREIDQSTLIDHCKILCKNDYYDVTVERSIQNYCGYPICGKELSDLSSKKQQYKICLQTHQVFDITDRKLFCSNLCFTSSNYLKDQLEEEPLWMREANGKKTVTIKKTPINLYKKTKASFGDEVKLDLDVTKDLIRELQRDTDNSKCGLYCEDCDKKANQDGQSDDRDCGKCSENKLSGVKIDKSINFPYIQEDDLKSLKDKLSKLKIKERQPNKFTEKRPDGRVVVKPILDKVIEKMDTISLDNLK